MRYANTLIWPSDTGNFTAINEASTHACERCFALGHSGRESRGGCGGERTTPDEPRLILPTAGKVTCCPDSVGHFRPRTLGQPTLLCGFENQTLGAAALMPPSISGSLRKSPDGVLFATVNSEKCIRLSGSNRTDPRSRQVPDDTACAALKLTWYGSATYILLNRQPPAEADFQRFFCVTPPSVHQMIIQLERLGFIRRTPRQARSIELLVPTADLPTLQPRKPLWRGTSRFVRERGARLRASYR